MAGSRYIRYTENEIILCTYIARFGRGLISEEQVRSLFDLRPVGSVKMKVQNIARMLSEEGYRHSQEVAPWGGGHRTDWHIVQPYADRAEPDFTARVKEILACGRHQSGPPRDTTPKLINIELRWDGEFVVGAKGRFHRAPPAEVEGLRIPYDELDWNDLRNQLYEHLSKTPPQQERVRRQGGPLQADPATRDRALTVADTPLPLDKTSKETRALFHDLKRLVKSLGGVQMEETTTVRARHHFKSVINFTVASGATPAVVCSVRLLVRGLDVHIYEKHLSDIPLEDGFTHLVDHDRWRVIAIRDWEHIRRAEPLLRAAYDNLLKYGHALVGIYRPCSGQEKRAVKPPVTPRRPGNSPSAASQRRKRRMGDRDYLQLGENHEP